MRELVNAIKKNDVEFFKNNLRDVNLRRTNGKTLLMYAAQEGKEEIFRLLLDRKADPTDVDRHGNSVFYYALVGGNEAIVSLLIDSNVDIISKTNCNNTSLHAAVTKSRNMIGKLIQLGVDVKARNTDGQTAWHLGAQLCNEDIHALNAGKEDLRQYQACRAVFAVIDHTEINTLLSALYDKKVLFGEGGYFIEAHRIYKHHLEEFCREIEWDKKIFSCLIDLEESISTEQFLQKAKLGPVLGLTGHCEHITVFTLQRYNNLYRLYLIDRGDFALIEYEYKGAYAYSRYIDVAENAVISVIDILDEAQEEDKEKAKELIFNDIPKMLGVKDYKQDGRTRQKLFRGGVCFSKNIDPLLFLTCINNFGTYSIGRFYYKYINGIYIKRSILNEFLSAFKGADKKYQSTINIVIKKIQRIIELNLFHFPTYFKNAFISAINLSDENADSAFQMFVRFLHKIRLELDEWLNYLYNDINLCIKNSLCKENTTKFFRIVDVLKVLEYYKGSIVDALFFELFDYALINPENSIKITTMLLEHGFSFDYKASRNYLTFCYVYTNSRKYKEVTNPVKRILSCHFNMYMGDFSLARKFDSHFYDNFVRHLLITDRVDKNISLKNILPHSQLLLITDPEYLLKLAQIYRVGGYGVTPDILTAKALCRKAMHNMQKFFGNDSKKMTEIKDAAREILNERGNNDSKSERTDITNIKENILFVLNIISHNHLMFWEPKHRNEIENIKDFLMHSTLNNVELCDYLFEKRLNLLANEVATPHSKIIKMFDSLINTLESHLPQFNNEDNNCENNNTIFSCAN